MKRSIGFDYSSVNVYYGIVNEQNFVEEHGVVSRLKDHPKLFVEDLIILLKHAKFLGINTVYIEKPWAREGAFAWTALETSAMATRIETAALIADLDYKMVDPGVWRKAVLGNGRPKDKKQAAIDWAKQTYGFDPPSLKVRSYDPDHNYCEAVAIAHYGLLQ